MTQPGHRLDQFNTRPNPLGEIERAGFHPLLAGSGVSFSRGSGWERPGGRGTVSTWALLVFAGVVTGLPLLLFSAAARRISLPTIGLLQYVAPSCQLLIGVAVYHEPFDQVRWLGFTLIWTALAIYSIESLWRMKWGPAGAIR